MTKQKLWHGHKFIKGVFVAPFNQLQNLKQNTWINGRLADYIWIGFILEYYGRYEGFFKLRSIFSDLNRFYNENKVSENTIEENSKIISDLSHFNFLSYIQLSKILVASESFQKSVYNIILKHIDKQALAPLTLIFTFSKNSTFSLSFYSDVSYEDRLYFLERVVSATLNHQSNSSTDIRYAIIMFSILTKKLCFGKNDLSIISGLQLYPTITHEDKRMHVIRSEIRALEVGFPYITDNEYTSFFWNSINKLGECKVAYLKYGKENEHSDLYICDLKKKMLNFSNIYVKIRPLDTKMEVLLGIATFAYKRLLEVVEHDLYNTIAGRSSVRCIIESYILMKYLLKHENENNNIWESYQNYGIGELKKICEQYDEYEDKKNVFHVDYSYIKLLMEEKTYKEFTNIDTRYFGDNIRNKAADVNESEIYKLAYDYDSQFEHALWGAVRESSMLACNCALHKYHNIPDIDNHQELKSVWNDCKLYMDYIIEVLENLYG